MCTFEKNVLYYVCNVPGWADPGINCGAPDPVLSAQHIIKRAFFSQSGDTGPGKERAVACFCMTFTVNYERSIDFTWLKN